MKHAEFHQAQITILFRIVDEDRSHGLQKAELQILMDSDPEWTAVRHQIRKAQEQLNAQLKDQQDADSN